MVSSQFYNHLNHISFVFLTGSSRVGKTTLASFLAQHPQLEFLDEPWEIMMFPLLMQNNLSENPLLISYFKAMLTELANDMMLYRRTNLRFKDASAVWKSKSPESIYERLLFTKNRTQVNQALAQQKIKILLILPETTPFINFFFNCIPNLSIIHLTRNGIEVANEIAEKKWFSLEQLALPKNNQLYHLIEYQDQSYYLPWWVSPTESAEFMAISDFERGLWYWHYFNNTAKQQEKELPTSHRSHFINFNSAQLFSDPIHSGSKLLPFIGLDPIKLSPNFLSPHMLGQICVNPICWSKYMPNGKRLEIESLLKTHGTILESSC